MAGGGSKAIAEALGKKLFTVNGAIALVLVLVLVIGFFVGSAVGRVICGLALLGLGVYAILQWKSRSHVHSEGKPGRKEEPLLQTPEGTMKKLLFDDFQSPGGSYVVKEVKDVEPVVPSTKTAQPVARVSIEEKTAESTIADFFDLDSDMFPSEAEPRSEFNFLLNKVLLSVRDVLFAHTVAFFWANREKRQMVLEARVTDSAQFMTTKRFAIGADILSQVAECGKPQILGRVNTAAEKDLVHYYDSTENIRSLVAVPVYYLSGSSEQQPVGVIVADSKAEDAFGAETLGWLGHFTKLVSALIKSYTDKYDLLLDSELLSSIRRLQDRIKSDPSEYAVLNALGDEANRLVNWDFLTIVMYAEDRHGWVLQKVVNKTTQAYVVPDQLVDYEDSIVGRVIRSNKLEVLDDVSHSNDVRFARIEKVENTGSFLCIPLSSLNRCYGALTLESKNASNFAGIEVETIYRLAENAALTLEVLYMNDLVKDFVIVDHLTGSVTKKYFMKEIEEEVQRAEDFGNDLALVSLAVDGMETLLKRYGKEGFESIMSQVAKIVRSNVRAYDIVGREEDDRFGVLLINTAASDAYLWAEKLRKQIASHVLTHTGKTFSVTVSAGVCGLSEGMHRDQLLAGTSRVLSKAIENGGNLVQVF